MFLYGFFMVFLCFFMVFLWLLSLLPTSRFAESIVSQATGIDFAASNFNRLLPDLTTPHLSNDHIASERSRNISYRCSRNLENPHD